jgi:hypothetical protein
MPTTTPTMQSALTTLHRVKEELGLELTDASHDAYLQFLINAATTSIEKFTGRKFAQETLVEHVPGYGSTRIMVSRTPIVEINEIRVGEPPVDPAVIDPTTYAIEDRHAGLIRRINFTWRYTGFSRQWIERERLPGTEAPTIAVDYKGGYVTPKMAEDDPELQRDLPYDLENAALMLITTRFATRGERRDIVTERVMSASFTYSRSELPQEVVDILHHYERVM